VVEARMGLSEVVHKAVLGASVALESAASPSWLLKLLILLALSCLVPCFVLVYWAVLAFSYLPSPFLLPPDHPLEHPPHPARPRPDNAKPET